MTPGLYCYTYTRTACMLVLDCSAACLARWQSLAVLALVLVSFLFAAFIVWIARAVR